MPQVSEKKYDEESLPKEEMDDKDEKEHQFDDATQGTSNNAINDQSDINLVDINRTPIDQTPQEDEHDSIEIVDDFCA